MRARAVIRMYPPLRPEADALKA